MTLSGRGNDLLQRHILVKGCGKGPTSTTREGDEALDVNPKEEDSDDDNSPTLPQ